MQHPRDEGLRPYATDRQWEILEAYWAAGGYNKAAATLGLSKARVGEIVRIVKARAARKGYAPEHDHTHPVPDGYKLRGVSTLYNKAGDVAMQWVKTKEDEARQAELLDEMAAGFAAHLPRADEIPAPLATNDDLLAAYPVGDHHFGMHSWWVETGDSYDLKIATQALCGAADYLVNATPAAGTALIPLLGDFFHYDSMVPVTPTNGNPLDSDSRFAKMVRVAIAGVRYLVRAALQKHGRVHLIIEIGNHDPVSSVFLMEALAQVYENDPRVTVDTSPAHFHYYEFGRNLIGTHHGHGVKLERLPLVMATDRPEAWGRTKHRYWWTGHVHKDRVLDNGGARVESFRVLPPLDAWAHQQGYRPGRSMTAIVLHREHGEVARFLATADLVCPKTSA